MNKETRDILANKYAMEALAEAEEDIRSGELTGLEVLIGFNVSFIGDNFVLEVLVTDTEADEDDLPDMASAIILEKYGWNVIDDAVIITIRESFF